VQVGDDMAQHGVDTKGRGEGGWTSAGRYTRWARGVGVDFAGDGGTTHVAVGRAGTERARLSERGHTPFSSVSSKCDPRRDGARDCVKHVRSGAKRHGCGQANVL
jgi:hypothetical protein